MISKLQHALDLAAQGFKVFPLFPNKKTPAITEWQKKATTDQFQIKEWWSGAHSVTNKGGRTWIVSPEANIGIHADGFVVLDIDVKNNKDGRVALKMLPPCKTRISKTPTGEGFHIIFKHLSNDIQNTTDFRPGIDIRTLGGFIVAPGSVVGGKKYRWVNPDTPVAKLPAKLRALISKGVVQTDSNANFGEVKPDYSKMPDVIYAGNRDDTLFSFACSWRERGINQEQAMILMKELHSRVEQTDLDFFPLETAQVKVKEAWSKYAPGSIKDPAVIVKSTIEIGKERKATTLQEAVDHFIFIEEGSRVADMRRHPTVAVLSLKDFKNSMRPDIVDGKEVSNLWLRSPARKTVRNIGYYPQENRPVFDENGATYFNTYYGSGLKDPGEIDAGLVNEMCKHLKYLYPDEKSYNLMLDWMAFTVQYPHERIPWCFLTISIKEGVGKGLMYALMAKVVGEHNSAIVQSDELSESGGVYNGYMSNKTLVCWDEIKTKASDRERLRSLITARDLMINHKYGAKQMEHVFANTMAFSNYLNGLHIGASDRRFFVECNYDEPKSGFYYDRLWKMIDGDLPMHWNAMLKKRDVSQFAWSSAPMITGAKIHMKAANVGAVESLIRDCVEEGTGPFAADIICPNIARVYIERIGSEYGIQETNGLNKKIATVVRSICKPLPNEKYTIPGGKKAVTPNRVRCVAIRKQPFWEKQSPAAIAFEYLKAKTILEKNVEKDKAVEILRDLYGKNKKFQKF